MICSPTSSAEEFFEFLLYVGLFAQRLADQYGFDTDGLELMLTDGEALIDADGLAETDTEGEALIDAEGLAEIEAEILALGDADMLTLGDMDGELADVIVSWGVTV